jgi:hypothetical protein
MQDTVQEEFTALAIPIRIIDTYCISGTLEDTAGDDRALLDDVCHATNTTFVYALFLNSTTQLEQVVSRADDVSG